MKAPIVAVLLSLASSAPVLAGTFVYVSNAEDGDIGMYTLQADGSLQPGQRFKANKLVMPMVVSPDKRFLIAAVRSKPFQAYSYSIDKSSGALNLVGTGTLAESYPYIALDRSGRFLLGASYELEMSGQITTRLFEKLKTRFYESTNIKKLVAMLYGEITDRGRFRYLSAGHPPPMVYR
jgi:6-phosphogluconolactonase